MTAALGQVPPPLIDQLKVGGRLVMPIGPAYTTQQLTVVEKTGLGTITTRTAGLVRFVPFTRSQDKKPIDVEFLEHTCAVASLLEHFCLRIRRSVNSNGL